jgi:hypothetical protein
VNGIGIRDLCRGHQVWYVQIGIDTGGTTNANSLIREFHVKAVFIGSGINRNGLDTHLPTGSDDPQRDLTTIGDQYFLEIYF